MLSSACQLLKSGDHMQSILSGTVVAADGSSGRGQNHKHESQAAMTATNVSALLIAGPTASGKSRLALRLAEHYNGAIINADSMQVYRDLRILTARPSAEDEARVPHLLFGHVDGAANYSVGRYMEDVSAALAKVHALGRLPIFVGGTGLYFKSLTQGLSEMPRVPEPVRAEWRARAQRMTVAELHAELAARDPIMAARLLPTDPQRILRALEVHAATGQSLAFFQAAKAKPLLDVRECESIFLAPGRSELRAAIDRRFDAMLAAGAIDEVAKLARRDLDPALPVMRALGVPQLLQYLRHESDLETAASLAARATRAYAKRQFTFARNQLPTFRWLTGEEHLSHFVP
jgi:tRNA dimethylallyltransferase